MTRSPMVPVLALASALALAACGGGGGGPDGDTPGTKDCDGTEIPVIQDCPERPGGNDDTDGDDGAGDENGNDGDAGNETGGGSTSTGGPGPASTGPTPTPTTPAAARGTYEALRDRILAAADPAALVQALDDATLTGNQYDALSELALVLDPSRGSGDGYGRRARLVAAARSVAALDALGIDLADADPALARLHAAHRAELVTREAARAALLAVNPRFDVPGDRVPSATAPGTAIPSGAAGRYGVWMDPDGQIHRWENPVPDPAAYTTGQIQDITAENRVGSFVDGRAQASYRGTASGFAAHIEVLEDGDATVRTAGEMAADVALTVAFGIDSDDDRFDVAPSLTGTIDNFRLVGRTGDLGWTATIDGDLRDGGAVDPGDIDTGKAPHLVRNVNDLSVAFSTDRVTGGQGSVTPDRAAPPTHAAGSFDLTFTDGRAVGAFNALPRERAGP